MSAVRSSSHWDTSLPDTLHQLDLHVEAAGLGSGQKTQQQAVSWFSPSFKLLVFPNSTITSTAFLFL